MLMVGSRALMHYCINLGRAWGDIDLICDRAEWSILKLCLANKGWIISRSVEEDTHTHMKIEFNKERWIIEASLIDNLESKIGNDRWLHDCGFQYFEDSVIGNCRVASPDFIYMMKLSHRYKDSVHFQKTRHDILLMREMGFEISGGLEICLLAREEQTIKKPYKLNVKKNEFFVDNVPYKYDHDSIHRAVAIADKPAYLYYQADNSEVLCSKNKFFDCTEETRFNGVIEEAYVLALERAVIPHGADPYNAFRTAMRKICTSVTSGWFREYAWENYDRCIERYDPDYVLKFNTALERGVILPYKKT